MKKREKLKVSRTGGKYEKNVKNSKSPVQGESLKKTWKSQSLQYRGKVWKEREKLKVSSTGRKFEKTWKSQSLQYRGKVWKKTWKTQSLQYRGKSRKNAKNSKSPVPVLREMLRKKKRWSKSAYKSFRVIWRQKIESEIWGTNQPENSKLAMFFTFSSLACV